MVSKSHAKRNIQPSPIPRKDDAEGTVSTDLLVLFTHVETKALEAIDWYLDSKRPKARWSQRLRIGAILFTTIGGLFPILAGIQDVFGMSQILSQWRYLALALGGACVGADRFFGFSSAWMRYTNTEFALQKVLAEFQLDWAILWAEVNNGKPEPEQRRALLERLKLFRLRVLQEIEQETRAWITEFKRDLIQLDEATRSRPKATQLATPHNQRN